MFFMKAHQGRNAWWRWLATISGTLTLWFAGHIPLLVFATSEARRLGLSEDAILGAGIPPGIDRNLFLLYSLLPFVVGFLALWFFIARLHRRPLLSAMTGRPRFDWRRAFLAFVLWGAILAAGTFAFMPAGSYHYQFDPAVFWPLLLIALALIPIQTTFEEVFFRGYLLQGVSLLTGNKITPLIVVTLIFTLVHFANPEFNQDYVKGGLSYLSLSLLFGLTAVIDDGLEVPAGIHAANNLLLVLVLNPVDGSFTTHAVFSASIADMMRLSPWLDIASAVLAFLLLAFALNWRFAALTTPTRPQEQRPV
jgi:membrane protease YdiL (CAAX protease family)